MKTEWNEDQITKALRGLSQPALSQERVEHVWMRLEDRLAARKHGTGVVWRPWVHPIRWVAAAACLCLAFTAVLYHQDSVEQNDMASYLINISNPIGEISQDQNVVKVSTLLSEPSSTVPEMTDEVQVDSLASDEIFL